MKKILFFLFLLTGFSVQAQLYNNHWIDYSRPYYKFKVGKTGLYRIQQPTLATAGLASASAEHFQLWRNGVQVPIYTSVASGAFSGTDYIEFWGVMNDGKPDKELYRNTDFQLNNKWSLETDTASYFLTVNTGGSNLRLSSTANNVTGNTLPAEPYFMHTVGRYFKDKLNAGYAVNVGEYLYSSAYDKGEGYTSTDIGAGGSNTFTFSNLFVHLSGPAAHFRIAVSGNDIFPHVFKATVNSNVIATNNVDYFNYSRDSGSVSLTSLSTNNAIVQVSNTASGRIVIHQYELTYPRQFNFGGAANFEFSLPASAAGNYLEISGFSYGSAAPVLYDLTNGKRYLVDVATPALLKVVLEPSAVERKLVMVSQEATNRTEITSLQSRTFTNYGATHNQGDYLIISHPVLFNGANGSNPVEEYKNYRSSQNGGGYKAVVCTIDELVDQFGFGIKKHPAAIRNFLQYARNQFSVSPKHVFLIGKGINYVHQRIFEANPDIDKLNLVPTFGNPASDILLSADPGDAYPKVPIGRLSVINAEEVALYLKKVKDYETAQRTPSPLIKDKAWMKNVVHAVGSSEPGLQAILDNYMSEYKHTISDTLFGANVTTFTKTSAEAVQQINNGELNRLFEEGISLITYFGHSSSSALEFNLNSPEQYNNMGKYPMFVGLGCNAGNFYTFNVARFSTKETLSEKFVLAPERGTIGFIASSHFGIVHYLDIYNSRQYNTFANTGYGKTIGEMMQSNIAQMFAFTSQEDFYARAQCEETSLHGDPAVTLNTHPKPDYAIEDQQLLISPNFVSVADQSFKINAKFLNLGKAISQKIVVEVKREYPNRTSEVIRRDTIAGIRYIDSLSIEVPIDPLRDKGANKFTITLDAGNTVEELFESNNSITKEIFIFEDEARTVYPYNLSIVNKQNVKFYASTANPFSDSKTYRFELDTTEQFNSPVKWSATQVSKGGAIEFNPSVSFRQNTVYYWRVGAETSGTSMKWSSSSFLYNTAHDHGFNQSHLFQNLKSTADRISFDSLSGKWEFLDNSSNLYVRNGVFPTTSDQAAFYTASVNGIPNIGAGCNYNEVIISVFDPITFKPWKNIYTSTSGLYNSNKSCGSKREFNFMYLLKDKTERKKAMDFLDLIPEGAYVMIRGNVSPNTAQNTYVNAWKADTAFYGSGNSLYHKLVKQGFNNLDSFNRPRSWMVVYKKGNHQNFKTQSAFSEGIYDGITLDVNCPTKDSLGYITSPKFGPARAWKKLNWSGESIEATSTDHPTLEVIGVKRDGEKQVLFENLEITQQNFDVSSVDVNTYPYLQLRLRNADNTNFTPFQLKSWNITYDPVPEGALAPNILVNMKDTFEIGEPLDFKIAFKNISEVRFDSLKVKMVITDRNNVSAVLPIQKQRPLIAGDTLHIRYSIDTKQLVGTNTLFLNVNPDEDQTEQHLFNNFVYKNFYVKGDTLNPLLDVTFDNTHILNGDIVSSKPDILIKLKDEAKWMFLDDTSLVTIQVRDPENQVKTFNYNSDTLRFTPARGGTGGENTATINLKPYFSKDGDYELTVKGQDKSNNQAGAVEYKVNFQVINKPMISNMLNYPNPFTTSTAFVFTITGTEVPQNLKIQILTVTGKIVREITKEELGPLRIGRNITEFKWDGTDQYGQKLANGVYLYRVTTNLNGKSLDKYKSENDNTDRYFNKGYGKMYLMR